MKNKVESISKCNKFWKTNTYSVSMIKDLIRTNLCHDKFCNNCKKVKQAARMCRYIPELSKYSDRLYHIVLTVPSVNSDTLRDTINKMTKAFKKLVNYFNLHNKIKDVDFSIYKYQGAVRSLEITFNENMYHPHLHCAFILENVDLTKTTYNVYSYDKYENRGEVPFSEFEILLQKIWYLLMNDIKVTKSNINDLELGYSVLVNKFEENDYAELFKYLTKEVNLAKDVFTYDNFKTLYLCTYGLKQIQGYGCLYRITDEDLLEEVERVYCSIRTILSSDEDCITDLDSISSLLEDNKYKLISRKVIYHYLNSITSDNIYYVNF